jgi:hypothetical protein
MTNAGQSERETTLLVAEFNALRSELLDHLGTARTIVGLYLISVGTIASLAVSGRFTPQIIVILPLLSAIFWWVHLDTRMAVTEIGRYIAAGLVPHAQELGSHRCFGWEKTLRGRAGWWLFKFSSGLDGSAWPIYLLPSILALFLMREGATAPITLVTEVGTVRSFQYPVWLWWLTATLQFLLTIRAFAIERSWWSADPPPSDLKPTLD